MAKSNLNTITQKLTISFLIILFAFSITPVALLHDAITRHKDVCYHNFHQKDKSISKADINCKCLSFVADVHFIKSLHPVQINKLPEPSPVKNHFYLSGFYSQHHFFAELRGPPTIA